MAILTLAAVEAAARRARDMWLAAEGALATWQYLFFVKPKQFPQTSRLHTSFASALFAELALLVGGGQRARVVYPKVPPADQDTLRARIAARTGIPVEGSEYVGLDFALLQRAAGTSPYAVRLAMESEMNPISGGGSDPDELVRDAVKLSLVAADYRFYLCRVNGGNESLGLLGPNTPKWDRLGPVLETALAAGTPARHETAALIMTTQAAAAPWLCRFVLMETGQPLVRGSFQVL